jgi:CRISPR system Cascade subunit CasB
VSEAERKKSQPERAALWWFNLQDTTEEGRVNPRADRAARARLRRAAPGDAMTDDAVNRLYRLLWGAEFELWKMKRTVRVALVLAHVRGNIPQLFGEALGEGGENAPLKPLRFKRLLQAGDEEDIIREFRRAVDLLGGSANVRNLAELLLNWGTEKTRARFAFEYLGARAAIPEAVQQSS